MTEQKLKKLFDYQRFERNERLEALIAETEIRCAKGLTDAELSFVSAAGDTQLPGGTNSVRYPSPTVFTDSGIFEAGQGGEILIPPGKY